MDIHSDSESVYSLDSLEGKSNFNSETSLSGGTSKTYLAKYEDCTVPYYKGEISVEDIKRNVNIKRRNTIASTKSCSNLEVKRPNSFKDEADKHKVNEAISYFWNDTPSKQQTSKQRISRRKELIIQNKNSLRARHRSVSYLEQFRKKNYGKSDTDSSSFSTAGSKLSDRDQSLSFISCLSGESRMSTSEVEFYDELMVSSGIEHTWNKESPLKSSTLLTEKAVKSAKPSKSVKQNKAKPIILSRVEVLMPDPQNAELDKKRSIEKREIYANKVKLRNQIKINRQKERDRNEKFQGSSVLSNFSSENCFLQPEINNICAIPSERKASVLHPPSVAIQETNSKSVIKISTNERMQKRRGMQKNNKKSKMTSELSSLQARHEREKSLIESMKNLILKT